MSALRSLHKSTLLQRQVLTSIRTSYPRKISSLSLPAPFLYPSILPPFLPLQSLTSLIPIFTRIWDSILQAVPKKKSSYSQKRSRQMAGKALKDKTNLTRCEACGEWRLLHTLCGPCAKSIQNDWRKRERLEEQGRYK